MATLNNSHKKRNADASLLSASSMMFALIVFLLPFNSFAQTPGWSWASSAGEVASDYGNSICTDINGNNYTTGYFSQSITFGNTTLTDAGGSDIFLVKYNNQGEVAWAKSFGGTSLDFANEISCDANGNLIFTGAFRSESIAFGSYVLTNPNSGNGYNAFFIAKVGPDGNVLWASTATGDGNCWGADVDTDKDGNIIVTGAFDGVSTTFGTTTLTNADQFYSDIFLVEYDVSGEVVWAQSFGGDNNDYGTGVATDNEGNINLIGRFESTSITFGNFQYPNTGGSDFFILHIDFQGNIIWPRVATGDGDESGNDIETNQFGDIFVTGVYAGSSATFNDLYTLPGNGYDNIFIVKYDKVGNIGWIQSVLGSENDEAYGLTLDNKGNLFVTGEFESNPLTFVGQVSLTNSSPGYTDLFVVKIKSDGSVAWAVSAGGNDDDFGEGVTTNSEGNAFVTGSFYSTSVLFGTTSLVNANSSNNSTDYFVAKLNSTTGIEDTPDKSTFSIYPNPAVSVVSLQSPVFSLQSSVVELYNLNGKKFLEKQIPAGTETFEIDVSSLKSGVYCCKVSSEKYLVTKKLIIQK